jgi:hypothetical protein
VTYWDKVLGEPTVIRGSVEEILRKSKWKPKLRWKWQQLRGVSAKRLGESDILISFFFYIQLVVCWMLPVTTTYNLFSIKLSLF